MPETKPKTDTPATALLRLMLENMTLRDEAIRTRIEAACPGALKELAEISMERLLWMEAWNEAMSPFEWQEPTARKRRERKR